MSSFTGDDEACLFRVRFFFIPFLLPLDDTSLRDFLTGTQDDLQADVVLIIFLAVLVSFSVASISCLCFSYAASLSVTKTLSFCECRMSLLIAVSSFSDTNS